MKKITKAEFGHTSVKAVISSIPLIGGAVSEVFSMFIASPLEKRRDEWILEVDKRLKSLELKIEDFNIQDLQHNELFISTFMSTTQIALRNHKKAKILALRNLLLNTAISKDIDEQFVNLFINLIDSFTEWHLILLKFLQNPQLWFVNNNLQTPTLYAGSINSLIIKAFKILEGKEEYLNLIAKDLKGKELITIDGFRMVMTETGIFLKRTSELGDYFLSIIEDPEN